MTTEDYGGVLVRFENSWDHEDVNSLWISKRDENCEIVTKSPTCMNASGKKAAHFPAGHPEGCPSVVKNICLDFYQSIKAGEASRRCQRLRTDIGSRASSKRLCKAAASKAG